jgi:hypothetical protein
LVDPVTFDRVLEIVMARMRQICEERINNLPEMVRMWHKIAS